MKIELIKETKVNGDVFYYTMIDGLYVSDSMKYGSDNEKVAREFYNNIVENKGELKPIKEVLESVEKTD
jgi:hypothetical protein